MVMLRNTPNQHILTLVLCIWIIPILFCARLNPVMEVAGEPVISQNGDGSYTASWDFDEPANYTAGNTSINSGGSI